MNCSVAAWRSRLIGVVTESDCVLVFHFAFGLDFASAFQVMVLLPTTALGLSHGREWHTIGYPAAAVYLYRDINCSQGGQTCLPDRSLLRGSLHGARFRGAAVLPLRGRSLELRERGAFQGCVEEYDFGDTRKYVAYAVVSVFLI